MKIKIFLLLMLIIPISVFAREEYYSNEFYYAVDCRSDSSRESLYSTDVTYENGMYSLSGTIVNNYLNHFFEPFSSPYEYIYSCMDDKENKCDSIYVYIKNSACEGPRGRSGKVAFKLDNGNTYDNKKSTFIATDYKKENGKYFLLNYEEHPFTDIHSYLYYSLNYKNYYVCENAVDKECSKLFKIIYIGNNIGGNLFSTVVDVEEYFLVSDNYKKEGNEFILINPKKVYPSTDISETGYTCLSHDSSCKNLSTILVTDYYDGHDGGRKNIINDLNINTQEKTHTLKKDESVDLKTFFSNEELNKAFSTNPSVADIKNNNLEINKVGETTIIYENDFTYKALHLKIIDTNNGTDTIISNPKTTSMLYLFVGLLLLMIMFIPLIRNNKTSIN